MRVVGVIPKAIGLAVGLSKEVKAAVPAAIDAVQRALLELGAPLRPRVKAQIPDLWWERPGGFT